MGKGPVALQLLQHLLLCSIAVGESFNPYEKGCLYAKNLTTKVRVCNSDDDKDDSNCRHPPIDYPEIRLIPQDWESVMFSSWILQILLSEILDVPTTLEMGDTTSQLNFYHPKSPFDYPVTPNYMTALENSFVVNGDCGKTDTEEYMECGHFVPEVWGGRKRDVQDMVHRGVIEPPLNVGQLAQEGWFIPKFTALRDPTLLSYLGYQGEENRHKMAERFLRPTTWGDYCAEVSPNSCTTPGGDGVAQRAPLEEDESDRMFVEGLYTGHFRQTEKGNCTAYPTTCTGHFADYPCDWRSPVPGQLYHLGISLDPELDDGGYTYSQLIEIWRAANATKSDVVLMWWTPQLLYGEFQGTEAEFTRVTLPSATQSCIEARVDTQWHCSPNLELRMGSPEATCMEPPNSLYSIMSSSVYDQTYGKTSSSSNLAEAEYSPSHEALSNYRLSELQIEEILVQWTRIGDPREALCGWVADNFEYLEAFIPRAYPRSFEHKDDKGPLLYVSTLMGGICMMLVIITFVAVQKYKHLRAIQHAQIEFLHLLLLGALLISIGAIVMGAPSSNGSCIVEVWLVNIGYTLELVPLIVKIGAVLHVMNSGKKLKRVRLKREMLFGVVALICILMIVYLIIWTAVDPPQVAAEYQVTDQHNNDGDTVVWVLSVCSSKSETWYYISVGWNAFLLLITTVLAIRMRKLNVKGFCETSTLALLVYSHFFFVILRVITYIFSVNGGRYAVAYYQSIIFSADTMATLAIYFVPKFFASSLDDGSSKLSIGDRRVSGLSLDSNDPNIRAFRNNGSAESLNQPRVRFQEPRSLSGMSGLSSCSSGISGSEEPVINVHEPPEQEPSRFRFWVRREPAEDEEIGNDNGSQENALLIQRIAKLQARNASLEEENERKTSRLNALEEELALLKKDVECEIVDEKKTCEGMTG